MPVKIKTRCACGMELLFDQTVLSQYKNFDGDKKNQKPIEVESGQIHSCSLRNWSHQLHCRTCSRAIMFNDKIVGTKGHKIPHSVEKGQMKPHVCVVVKQ